MATTDRMKLTGTILRRHVAIAALIVALPLGGAQAQAIGGNGPGGAAPGGGHKQHGQKADQTTDHAPKADEKAYAAALKTVPDKQFDPWHGVR